jgi:hypothetical protein
MKRTWSSPLGRVSPSGCLCAGRASPSDRGRRRVEAEVLEVGVERRPVIQRVPAVAGSSRLCFEPKRLGGNSPRTWSFGTARSTPDRRHGDCFRRGAVTLRAAARTPPLRPTRARERRRAGSWFWPRSGSAAALAPVVAQGLHGAFS